MSEQTWTRARPLGKGGVGVGRQSLYQCLGFPSLRWLAYLLLLILDLVICLTMCLWMAKQSRWLLIT